MIKKKGSFVFIYNTKAILNILYVVLCEFFSKLFINIIESVAVFLVITLKYYLEYLEVGLRPPPLRRLLPDDISTLILAPQQRLLYKS